MTGCDVVINTTICGNSAVDRIAELVAGGMKLVPACKQVAGETDKKHGTTTKWSTLKKKYQRANETGTVSHSKKEATIPTVDEVVLVDNTITIPKVDYDILLAENEGLALAVEELDKEVKRLKNIISPPKDEPQAKGTIDRETAFKFIKDYGNKMQVYAITKDNPTNNRLFNIFSVVVQNCLKTMPPHTLPTKLLEATKIV